MKKINSNGYNHKLAGAGKLLVQTRVVVSAEHGFCNTKSFSSILMAFICRNERNGNVNDKCSICEIQFNTERG